MNLISLCLNPDKQTRQSEQQWHAKMAQGIHSIHHLSRHLSADIRDAFAGQGTHPLMRYCPNK